VRARRLGIAWAVDAIKRGDQGLAGDRLPLLAELPHILPQRKARLEGWPLLETGAGSRGWRETVQPTGWALAGE
jgi:hypothetical protein